MRPESPKRPTVRSIRDQAEWDAIDCGNMADKARATALKYPPHAPKRKHALAMCRVWALAEARFYTLCLGHHVAPNYKRTKCKDY